VIVISGAMVASLALPASAANSVVTSAVPVGLAVAVTPPAAAQAPLVPQTFGAIGFSGVSKPKPRPVVAPVRERVVAVSRSTTRTPISPAPAPAPEAPAPATSGVLGIAASLAGIYYVYGGTTTAGFDCSGFTQYVFNKVGVSLPRTAEQQRQATTPVSDPQPGDLVFFGAPAYHNGIYAGDGMMWDSPRSGKAVAKRAIWSSTVTYGRP